MPKTYLLLVDINGALCYRSEKRVQGARPTLKLRKRFVYARPGVERFLTALSNARFDIYIYTSMTKRNAIPTIRAVLPNFPQLTQKIFDRTFNKPDPDGENHWDTIRDMDTIWSTLPKYGPHNTVILDNERKKFRDNAENGIVVDQMTPAQIRENQCNTLNRLREYLLDLSSANPSNIPTYIAQNPFLADGQSGNSTGSSSRLCVPKDKSEKCSEIKHTGSSKKQQVRENDAKYKARHKSQNMSKEEADVTDVTEALAESLQLND